MLLFCAMLAIVDHAGSAFAAERQPLNVVLLVGDDHGYYVTGCYGNKLARTPNIDRLAAGGMRFDRAYCNSPMCTSSRQSFLCGRYPRATQVMCLTDKLAEDELTLADYLGARGYRTGAFGKMHFNSPLRHGFEVAVTERGSWAAYEKEHPPSPLPAGVEVLGPWHPFKDPARIWLNGMYLPYPRREAEMESTFYANRAIEFIKAHRDEPFFVQVGFREPHSPFWFPVERRNTYEPSKMPVPKPGPQDAEQVPLIFRDLSTADKQGIIASAYTSTAFLDANVGRVVDAIREAGLTDRTLIIYLADNGYHLGHHGRFEKHSFFERAVRCPLIMSLPGRIRPGSSTESLVEFVDLFPTILDLAKLPTPEHVTLHGRSLAPVLADPARKVRDFVVSEYAHSEEAMIRTARWKLIYHTGKRERDDGYTTGGKLPGRNIRLYDVENDPEEMTNLAPPLAAGAARKRDPSGGSPADHDHEVAVPADYRAVIEDLMDCLHDRLVATERDPGAVPRFATREDAIDWCLTRIAERRPASAPDAARP